MSKILVVKPVINKSNGQINFCLPKKKLPKKFIEDSKSITKLKIRLEDWF